MLNRLLLFAILLLSGCCIFAQDKSQEDKIYLKNGTIIKGVIIEEIPNKTISILQTNNGKDSIHVYKSDIVIMVIKGNANKLKTINDTLAMRRRERNEALALSGSKQPAIDNVNKNQLKQNKDIDITAPLRESIKQSRIEQPSQTEAPIMIEQDSKVFVSGAKTGDAEEVFDPFSPILPPKPRRQWSRDISGFRAFFDQGLTLGIGNIANHRWGTSASIGIQFNPIFYTGIGISYDMTLNDKEGSVPIFINPRINFLDNNDIVPFLDLRTGWSFLEGKGFYASPTAGISFVKGTSAYNVGLGYSFQRAKYKFRPDKSTLETIDVINNFQGLFIRFTFEFNIYRF